MVTDKLGDPVTEERWIEVGAAIASFIRRYPRHWAKIKNELSAERTRYQLATGGDLKKSGFRNTASFPVVYRKRLPEEYAELTGEEEEPDIVEVESLLETLQKLLPGLVAPDSKGKTNRLYREFLKRFPVFMPGERY
jgi:hypothetical protein